MKDTRHFSPRHRGALTCNLHVNFNRFHPSLSLYFSFFPSTYTRYFHPKSLRFLLFVVAVVAAVEVYTHKARQKKGEKKTWRNRERNKGIEQENNSKKTLK